MVKTLPILFLSFVCYSFLGWCCESVYCSVLQKKLINRGFLSGPVCPVYGFGAMSVVLLLSPFRESVLLVFVLGMLVASGVEYATACLLERIFHAKWWDYSHYRFNIHGRVCLLNSLMFGALSVVAVCWLHPPLQSMLERIPLGLQWLLTLLLGMYFAVDTYLTSREILRLNGKLAELEAIASEAQLRIQTYRHALKERMADQAEEVEERLQRLENRLSGLLPDRDEAGDWLDELLPDKEELTEAFHSAMERLESRLDALEQRRSAIDRRLLRAFPDLRSKEHPKAMQKLRELKQKKSKE